MARAGVPGAGQSGAPHVVFVQYRKRGTRDAPRGCASGKGGMRIDYLAPTPGWAPAISVFGHIHSVAAPSEEVVPALLPNLHLRLAGEACYRFGDGRQRPAPRAALVGATNAAFGLAVGPGYEMLCIGFLPEGWRTVVDVPAGLLADDVLDAGAVWPAGEVDALWHAVGEARDMIARRALVERFLARRWREGALDRARRGAAVQAWLERPGALVLDDLARALDLSVRQAERLTGELYGASPKLLAMKYRALRAAGTLAVHGADALPRAMADHTDQSHLIRDFRRFLGCTPGGFLRERQAIAHATMHGRWAAGVRSPLALLS
jgi:AraC-like DNA-binding protein